MKTIPLTRGKFAFVDDDDFELVNKLRWQFHPPGYAVHSTNGTKIRMHHLIMGKPKLGLEIDHVNGNGLDNRRSNLRIANKSQNAANCQGHRNNTSGFKGVHFFKRKKKWQASIRHNNRSIHLGYFQTAEQAARAYDSKAMELKGEFARTNYGQPN